MWGAHALGCCRVDIDCVAAAITRLACDLAILGHGAESKARPGGTPIRRLITSKHCNSGLDDRCRDNDGEIRRKNGSTRVDTLRQTYGEHFAPGVRGDMKLENLLGRKGADSLSELLRRGR